MSRLLIMWGVILGFSVEALAEIRVQPLGATDLIEVVGPVQVRIRHGLQSTATYDAQLLNVERQGDHISFSSTTPTVLNIEGANFKALKARQGQVFVRLEGTERLLLPQVVATEVRLLLTDRSRFDSEDMTVEHLQISLSGQGKANLANVSAGLFELDLRDHGDLEVSGLAQQQDVELRDFAHYDGSELRSEHASVALNDYAAGYIHAATKPTIKTSVYSSLSAR